MKRKSSVKKSVKKRKSVKSKIRPKVVKITFTDDNVKTDFKVGGKKSTRNISLKRLYGALGRGLVLRTGIMSLEFVTIVKRLTKNILS